MIHREDRALYDQFIGSGEARRFAAREGRKENAMKYLMIALVILGVALLAAPLFAGGGDSDSPFDLPRLQLVGQEGGNAMLLVGQNAMFGPFAVMEAKYDAIRAQFGLVIDNGVGSAELLSDWHDQNGTHHIVRTTQGAGEKEREFRARHIETVKEMQVAFPPYYPTPPSVYYPRVLKAA